MSTGLRVLGAYRAGARVAHRPGSRVAHITPAAPLTPSGRHLPRSTRPVCGARTRQLRVLAGPLSATARGLRFCRRCTQLLPVCLGRFVGPVVTREDRAAAYGHLTVDDLTVAARWCQTVDDTHAVSTVASVVHGPAPFNPPRDRKRDRARSERYDLEQLLIRRRNQLREAELCPEVRAERDARKEAEDHDLRVRVAQRRRDAATEVALEREYAGRYLTDRQQYLVDHAV